MNNEIITVTGNNYTEIIDLPKNEMIFEIYSVKFSIFN